MSLFDNTVGFSQLKSMLDSIGFESFYREHLRSIVQSINYGVRKGEVNFGGLADAGEQYNYKQDERYTVGINSKVKPAKGVELLLQCIEVFDWGGVQKGNIINAINLYRTDRLEELIFSAKTDFENDSALEFLHVDHQLAIWSSGWTKIYSLMFDLTTIYDSRVAAFLNWVVARFMETLQDDENRALLQSISSHLFTVDGNNTRERGLSKESREQLKIDPLRKGTPLEQMEANKLASWLLRVIANYQFGPNFGQSDFRQVDKAFFMLGFDLKQLK